MEYRKIRLWDQYKVNERNGTCFLYILTVESFVTSNYKLLDAFANALSCLATHTAINFLSSAIEKHNT